jgi:hypothetical protein
MVEAALSRRLRLLREAAAAAAAGAGAGAAAQGGGPPAAGAGAADVEKDDASGAQLARGLTPAAARDAPWPRGPL